MFNNYNTFVIRLFLTKYVSQLASPKLSTKIQSGNINKMSEFKSLVDELTSFLQANYLSEIMTQIPSKFNSKEVIDIKIRIDMTLLQDQEPRIGLWVTDFYESFIRALQRSVYGVIITSPQYHFPGFEFLREITLESLNCQLQLSAPPLFKSPINDPQFKLLILSKAAGQLINLKNCVVKIIVAQKITSVLQPELYLASQCFESKCGCQTKYHLRVNHLINQLKYQNKQNSNTVKCGKCQEKMIELIGQRRFLPCQELKIHCFDLSPLNVKKFSNFISQIEPILVPINQQVRSDQLCAMVIGDDEGRHNYTLPTLKIKQERTHSYSLYVYGADVNRFEVGQEILAISYYNFNTIQDGKFSKIISEYFVAVQVNTVNHLVNRGFFTKFISDIHKQTSTQMSQPSTNIIGLIQKTARHFQQSKMNLQLQYENWQIIQKICDMTSKLKYQFPLQISLLSSIFWQNRQSLSYNFLFGETRSNIEINQKQDQIFSVNNKIDICIIYEDEEIVEEQVKHLTRNLEDVQYFPIDADDNTITQFLYNFVKGGILIVKYNLKMRKSSLDTLKQVLCQNPINGIVHHCTVWFLLPLMEAYAEAKNYKDVFTLSKAGRLADFKNSFDIILDLTSINNNHKSVNQESYIQYSEELIQRYIYNSKKNFLPVHPTMMTERKVQKLNVQPDFMNTHRKPQLNQRKGGLSVSSCHIIEPIRIDPKRCNDQLRVENEECLSTLLEYFKKMRDEKHASSALLSSLYKVAQGIALIRQYVIAELYDKDGIYKDLISSYKDPVNIAYIDTFLSVLLAIETRININGSGQALFGSDTSNYLHNQHRLDYVTFGDDRDNTADRQYNEFRKLFRKIM